MSRPSDAEHRRRRRVLRKAQDKLWAETMGPTPSHILLLSELNTDPILKEPFVMAPQHMTDKDNQLVDKSKCGELTQSASVARSDKRARRMAEIRYEVGGLWGARGKAEEASDEFFDRTGVRVAVRTIQNYFRISRVQNARTKATKL